ncbi:cryptochrome/photolyase family protein [Haladaptatus sp. NG-SE-30]
MDIHWHRRDLRVEDNRTLATGNTILPVFVFDRAVLDHASPPRVSFLLDTLESLREAYRERGGDLLVVSGDPREELPRIAEERGAERVVWNRDYSGLAKERDAAVADALADVRIDHRTVHDALLHEPGTITTNQGDHYSVFSYFWKKWRDRAKDAPLDAPSEVDTPGEMAEGGGTIPSLADLDFEEPDADVQPAGIDAARDVLSGFCEDDIYSYDDHRDYPAREATSRLSPHLKFGTVGIREVWQATEDAKADAWDEDAAESVESFQRQLAWREFYAHVLDARPDVVVANYKDYQYDIAWRDDRDGLQAWRAGETGYPIVDAGMRQLRDEGWMHNRTRMVVASFLTKDLLVDWHEGYDWFRRKLVDHDTANDTGGWQWAASTGTDAQPYFRIFNPMTQGKRFDPDAEYIRKYVPELEGVPPKKIHSWHELDDSEREELAPDYHAPIVEHADRREMAISMFENARG